MSAFENTTLTDILQDKILLASSKGGNLVVSMDFARQSLFLWAHDTDGEYKFVDEHMIPPSALLGGAVGLRDHARDLIREHMRMETKRRFLGKKAAQAS